MRQGKEHLNIEGLIALELGGYVEDNTSCVIFIPRSESSPCPAFAALESQDFKALNFPREWFNFSEFLDATSLLNLCDSQQLVVEELIDDPVLQENFNYIPYLWCNDEMGLTWKQFSIFKSLNFNPWSLMQT